jgi:hypothetical protein
MVIRVHPDMARRCGRRLDAGGHAHDQRHGIKLLGFSKSGNGALTPLLRHPHVFSAAAAWDAPAQFINMSAFPGM